MDTRIDLGDATFATVVAELGETEYGSPRPTIAIRFPASAHHRVRGAKLHRLAALVEEATPEAEGWVVQVVDGCYEQGFIYLELVEGDKRETISAMGILRHVVTKIDMEDIEL